jgi:hypothetical protein
MRTPSLQQLLLVVAREVPVLMRRLVHSGRHRGSCSWRWSSK